MTKIRSGQALVSLTRSQFRDRFNLRFYGPAFEGKREAIERLDVEPAKPCNTADPFLRAGQRVLVRQAYEVGVGFATRASEPVFPQSPEPLLHVQGRTAAFP
jgi:hypothetical protein